MKTVKLVLKIMVTLTFAAWAIMVFTDYFKTRNDKHPIFCLKENTHKYDDGETYECIGLGYKMYDYKRDSITAKEFGPFFIKERTNTEGIK